MFGSSNQFTFGSTPTTSPFGTTSTAQSSAPATTGFLFGSTAAPAAGISPATSLNSTFTFGAPAATATAATPVTSQPFTFGSGLQNASTIRPFGTTSVFGSTPTATTSTTGATGFGGTSLFGSTVPTTSSTSIFGSTPSTTFGIAPTGVTSTTNVFGSTVATANQTGTTTRFEPVAGQDTMRTKNNTFQTINTKIQCLCAMKEYLAKSMEELRMEDYQANRKFPAANTVFGGTNFSSGSTFTSPFGGTSTYPATSTTSSIFGGTTTTNPSPFATTAPSTSTFAFGAAQTQTPSIFGTSTATTTSPFGAVTSTTPAATSIFSATQPTTNIFGSSTSNTSPFGAKQTTTQPSFGFGQTTSAATPFSFGSQPSTATSIFSQPATSTPFGATSTTTAPSIFGAATSTAPTTSAFGNPFGTQTSTASNIFGATTNTSTTGFTPFGSTAPVASTTNIFGAPATSTTTTAPLFSGFGAQSTTSGASPFAFNATSSAPSIFGSNTTNNSTSTLFNTQPFPSFGSTQTQPTTSIASSFSFPTSFGGTSTANNPFGTATMSTINQPQTQQNNIVSPVSITQQRFLAASLLDPFASRGKKTFTDIDQIKPPTDLIVVTTSTTTTTVATTTSTPTPITLPIQSNAKKHISGRPLVDIRFRLQPVSPSPASTVSNDDTKSPIQTPTPSNAPVKSPLMADFSEEEEMALIGKNKLTKLRLSNDIYDARPSLDSSRSLYPTRSRAELEKSVNINNNTHIISNVHGNPSNVSTTTIDTASAYASTTIVNNEQTLHPSGNNRPIIPIHHSTPIIPHKQPSPPSSHQSTTLVQSPTSPPPPSTTPPPSTATLSTNTNNVRTLNPSENLIKIPSVSTKHKIDSISPRMPTLTRPLYYTKPKAEELRSMFTDDDECIIRDFTVGHETYGSVTFYGLINVAGLNLDEIILFDRHEATVYPDDDNKPPVGQELNIPARITLLDVYPTDRTTRQEIRDVERIKAMDYRAYLADITKRFDGKFIDYNPIGGSWTFMVQHFTRYGLDGTDDEFVISKAPAGAAAAKPVAKQTTSVSKVVDPNILDQTVALNETYALSPPKSQRMDTEEKENSTTMIGVQKTVRFLNQSLLSLSPVQVAQLAQSMFDDDENDFNSFPNIGDPIKTSTTIIPSEKQQILINREVLNPELNSKKLDENPLEKSLVFKAEKKIEKQRVYSTLPEKIVKVRGKYFRTNFSGENQFVSVDGLNEKRVLVKNAMNFSEKISENIESFFSLYYNGCVEFHNDLGGFPRVEVRQNGDVIKQFIEFYSQIRDEKNIEENSSLQSLTDYSLEVLELCRLLWAPISSSRNFHSINPLYYEQQKRREMLSNWLEQSILSQPNSERWTKQNCELLSRGLFNDCVQFAHEEGEIRLAALVYGASGSDQVRDLLGHGAHEELFQFYSNDFQRTIAILSGEFIVNDKNFVDPKRTIFWQKAFALHLWFAHPSSDLISTIVNDFEQGFSQNFWLEPTTHYGNKKSLDLRWKLLKLFADQTYPIEHVFEVQSYTSNPFDFRLSWILYVTLRSLGNSLLSNENDTILHINYAQQLENLGLWKLSIFVLLHINDRKNRQKTIDEFLQRHLTANAILNEDEKFLIEKFNLPENKILIAKAKRAEYEFQWMDSVVLWIKARQWQRAHEIYCGFVFHQTLLEGNYQFAKEVLDALDHQQAHISHWNRRGGFVRQYVELLLNFEKIHDGEIRLNQRVQENLLSQVHRICNQLNDVLTDQTLKKISIGDICRRLLSVLNYARLSSKLKNFNLDNEEILTEKRKLFDQSIVTSVPCSWPVDFLVEQIQLQLHQNRH